MSVSIFSIYAHIVFSTKYRKNIIPKTNQPSLNRLLVHMIGKRGGKAIAVNGTQNHIHILCIPPKEMPFTKFVSELKTGSTRKLRSLETTSFSWQRGYAAYSVEPSRVETVKSYIRNQEKHHESQSFEKELIEILQKHNIDFQPSYLFDRED
jgi:REP element-mobilizing transposase RayT